MTGFLDGMAAGSRARAAAAMAREPLTALRRRCTDLPPAAALRLGGAFDLIAELKLRSPSQGALAGSVHDIEERALAYAHAGAAAVSVLTEPDRFDGSLEHLRRVAAALAPTGVPAMRKDFLVDPYQLYEARAAGAGGALLIVRMLTPTQLDEMLDCARQLGLFVLLEAFDAADLEVVSGLVEFRATAGPRGRGGRGPLSERLFRFFGASVGTRPDPARADAAAESEECRVRDPAGRPLAARPNASLGDAHATSDATRSDAMAQVVPLLVGVNSRDLQTLQVEPGRLADLAPRLPRQVPRVAESGLETPADAARAAGLGYDMALVGSALMRARDPGALIKAMIAGGRAARG